MAGELWSINLSKDPPNLLVVPQVALVQELGTIRMWKPGIADARVQHLSKALRWGAGVPQTAGRCASKQSKIRGTGIALAVNTIGRGWRWSSTATAFSAGMVCSVLLAHGYAFLSFEMSSASLESFNT